MPVLSQDEKGQVIGHLESVKSISEVAKMFGCTRATIHSLKQKFAATGTLKRKKGSGRKISTTEIPKAGSHRGTRRTACGPRNKI